MNNREAMQKAFDGQKFKVFSPFKCDITKNEGGNYVHDETIFAFAWFCRGLASQASELSSNPLHLPSQAQQPTKLVFDSESARQFLLENVLPNFSDSTFQKYVLEELAGDFAYQLVMYLQSQAQQEPVSQWQPIATAPKNKKIIVRYKNVCDKDRTVFAKYIEEFTEEANSETECETDYHEERDTYYFKEGWVEMIDNWDEFSCVYFDSRNVPTHWMDILPAPEGGDK